MTARRALIAVAAMVGLSATFLHASPTDATPRVAATAAAPASFSNQRIKITPIVSLNYPISMAVRPTDNSRWFALKGGTICRFDGSSCTTKKSIAVSTGNEQGLLGITFSPTGKTLFASYTNTAGDTRVVRYPVSTESNLGTARTIFSVDQPYDNHNGGHIAFSPAGNLWFGLGDGGSGGDPQNRAQNDGTYLGKIVKVDYSGAGNHRILIKGVRNPWRWSFDRDTDSLWVADVGQNRWEEITRLSPGHQVNRNLGWSRYEGKHLYNAARSAPGAVPPLWEYGHVGSYCSITGGYVYRGSAIPALRGAYLFADFCDGEIQAIKQVDGVVGSSRKFGVRPGNVVSFGETASGEVYVMTPKTVYRIDAA